MKLRHIKRRHDARKKRWIEWLDALGLLWSDDEWIEEEWPEEDYAGCTACASCGAGVNPHDEDECWLCGAEL